MTDNPTKQHVWLSDDTVKQIYALARYYYGSDDIGDFMACLAEIVERGIDRMTCEMDIALKYAEEKA